MLWENLTAPEFAKTVKKVGGVCLLPLGVIEKHGEHLPLGTDLMTARYVCEEAAKREPAIVFPSYYLTQIHEAKHEPGAIAISGELMMKLLWEVCDEISRNGLKKIVLVNGHGGNNALLDYFCQLTLERERDYTVYYPREGRRQDPKVRAVLKDKYDGHAGEFETSVIQVIRPQDVRMRADVPSRGYPKRMLKHLPEIHTGIWWYAEHPDHYAGQARLGSSDKGRLVLSSMVKGLVDAMRLIRKDRTVAKLTREFFAKSRRWR